MLSIVTIVCIVYTCVHVCSDVCTYVCVCVTVLCLSPPAVSTARDCGHSQGSISQGSCDLTEELYTEGNTFSIRKV